MKKFPSIVLSGSVGAGKSTFANNLADSVKDYTYVYTSHTATRIPMMLKDRGEDLYSLNKDGYLEIVKQNLSLVYEGKYNREELNNVGKAAVHHFGPAIFGELINHCYRENQPIIVDGIAGRDSVSFLKDRGYKIVYLYCNMETQLSRAKLRQRTMDTGIDLSKVIEDTNRFLDLDACKELADFSYNTDELSQEELVNHFLEDIKNS